MQTLIINAHPDFQNQDHYSIRLYHDFISQFKGRFPHEEFQEINLYDMEIPQVVNGQLYSLWEKQAQQIELSKTEIHAAEINRQLLQQFKEHHRIVIVIPLHNFTITSRLKDYIDNILVARETFKYTPQGSVGLMTDDYRVLLLQGSGSIYTNHDRYTPLEFSRTYLEAIFTELMGFTSFQIVRAQGTQVDGADPQKILTQATHDLASAVDEFYRI